MRKAKIFIYYQVVDDENRTIEDAHTRSEANKIKKEWENSVNYR